MTLADRRRRKQIRRCVLRRARAILLIREGYYSCILSHPAAAPYSNDGERAAATPPGAMEHVSGAEQEQGAEKEDEEEEDDTRPLDMEKDEEVVDPAD